MSTLKQKLIGFAAASGIAALTVTAASAEETPTLKDLTTGGEALIEKTDAPQNLGGIQYRFEDLASNAETKAQYLKIQKLLPAINDDIQSWRDTPKDERPKFPTSDNIYTLQGLLGITGDDRDSALGPQTASALTYLASTPVGRYGDDNLPKLDIESHSYLSSHIQQQTPGGYTDYLENVGETHTEAISDLTTKLDEAGSRAAKLTELAFKSCTGEQLALNKDGFVRSIVEALDSEEGKIDAAVEVACKDILDLATSEQRPELLASLQENLAGDITTMRTVIQTETEKAQLRALIEKYPTAALNDVVETHNRYPEQTGP